MSYSIFGDTMADMTFEQIEQGAREREPFTVAGQQLTFEQLTGRRLFPNECSHRGPAVFKWEGLVTRVSDAGRMGQLGILFDEADDIARRIQQYAAAKIGTLDYMYREFLLSGDIRLFICRPHRVTFDNKEPGVPFRWFFDYWVATKRAVLLELLMLDCYTRNSQFIWLVNRGFPQ